MAEAPKCTVLTSYCLAHGFNHGAEAEELREGIEKIVAEFEDDKKTLRLRRALKGLLEKVDARDSVAFLEAQRKFEPPEPPPSIDSGILGSR